jgi:hypothetical protein
MNPRAAVWKISREVMEAMLRAWFKKTRCQDDPVDISLLDVGHDGRNVVALVELVDGKFESDDQVKKFIDRLVIGS